MMQFYKQFTDAIPSYDGVSFEGLHVAHVYVRDWRFYENGAESEVPFFMVERLTSGGYEATLHIYPVTREDREHTRWDTATVVKAGGYGETIPAAYRQMTLDAGGKLTAPARDVVDARRPKESPFDMSPRREQVYDPTRYE